MKMISSSAEQTESTNVGNIPRVIRCRTVVGTGGVKTRRLLLLLSLLVWTPFLSAEQSKVKKAEKNANEVLDDIEKAVKGGIEPAKKGGNSFLQKIDDGVHAVWNKIFGKSSKK